MKYPGRNFTANSNFWQTLKYFDDLISSTLRFKIDDQIESNSKQIYFKSNVLKYQEYLISRWSDKRFDKIWTKIDKRFDEDAMINQKLSMHDGRAILFSKHKHL